MKKILLILLITINAFAFNYYKFFGTLSLEQQKFLYTIYQYSKLTRYKWTLVAIAWKETLAGVAMVNVFDGGKNDASCGPYHNLLSSVFKRHPEWIKTKFNMNKICTLLIRNFSFATSEAVAELDYWYKKRHGDWMKIWASYNGGSNLKKGERYAKDIYIRVKTLRIVIGNKWDSGFYRISYK
jgi:hypothetical protein